MGLRKIFRFNRQMNLREPSLVALAVFIVLLLTFPHLHLPGFRSSLQIPFGTSRPMQTMPGTDTDGDGLYDNIERKIGTSPLVPDSDADGLRDGEEYEYWTERSELELKRNETDPWLAGKFPDEVKSRLVQRYRPDRDLEGDGLINIRDADADADGNLDGDELFGGTDPAHPDAAGSGGPGTDVLPPDSGSLPPPGGPGEPGSGEAPAWTNLDSPILDSESFQRIASGGAKALFFIEPADRPRYWRTTTFDTYDCGTWSIPVPLSTGYRGEVIELEVLRPQEVPEEEFRVEFNGEGTGYLPNALHTTRLYGARPDVSLSLDRLLNFHTTQVVRSYNFTTFVFPLTLEALKNATIDQRMVSTAYCSAGKNLPSRVGNLAAKLTAGLERPYEKVSAILSFLRTSCEFDPVPGTAPPGEDLVDNFLFGSRRGSSLEFASAFVLLCRHSGVPSRLVTGFALGEQLGGKRVIRAAHYHVWAEVHFAELGWVQFEASDSELPGVPGVVGAEGKDPSVGQWDAGSGAIVVGGGGGGTTRNESTQEPIGVVNGSIIFSFEVIPEIIMKGELFTVCGRLIVPIGVSGCATVSVFMDEPANLVGRGRALSDGSFSLLCSADAMPVGERAVGLAASIFHRGILYTSETPWQQMKRVALISATTLFIETEGEVVSNGELFYSVTLRDSGGLPPLSPQSVMMCWNDSQVDEIRVGRSAQKSSFWVSDPPGNYSLTAVYNGSKYLLASCATKVIRVRSAGVRIELRTFPQEPVAGGQLFVEFGLLSEKGEAINESLSLSFDGELVGVFKAGGVVTIELPEHRIAAGDHRLTVSFAGNDYYVKSSREVEILVKGTSRILLPTGSLSVGTSPELLGYLRDNLGRPIRGATVHVRWSMPSGEEEFVEKVTFSSGDFRFQLKIPDDTPTGMLALCVDFFGGALHVGTSNTTYLPITSPSYIYAAVAENLTRGESVRASGRIEDHLHRPIGHAQVTLKLNGELCGWGWSDEAGGFEIYGEVPLTLNLGEATAEIGYAGEGYRESAVCRAGVVVHSRSSLRVSVPAKIEQGRGFEVVVVLIDDKEEPVAGHNITAIFMGKKQTRATDLNGRAVFRLEFPWLSTREELRVFYKGEQYYRPARWSAWVSAEPVFIYRLVALVAVMATLVVGYYITYKYGVPLRRAGLAKGGSDLSWLTDRYRRTIHKVYKKMLSEMEGLGAPKEEAWTVREYEAELARKLRLDLHSLHLLTSIFEEARYSRHTFTGVHSRRAVLSYRKLMNSLGFERFLRPQV